jgi:CHAD domain-containing protein
VHEALRAAAERYTSHESGVAAGRDPEALHQTRVAVRRLRSDLRSFRPLVDRTWADMLRQELRRLGTELGAVRDLDVLIERLRADAARAGAGGDAEVRALIEHVQRMRAGARETLLAEFRSKRYRSLRARIAGAGKRAKLTLAAGMPARDAFAPIVKKRWKRLRAAVRCLRARPSASDLHRIRILAKRCRYAAEAAAPAFGKRAERFADKVAALQDVLGEHHDAVTACACLRRLRRRSKMRAAAAALLAVETVSMARARNDWPGVWRALDRKSLRSWF